MNSAPRPPESDIPIPATAIVDTACAALGLSASKPKGRLVADDIDSWELDAKRGRVQ